MICFLLKIPRIYCFSAFSNHNFARSLKGMWVLRSPVNSRSGLTESFTEIDNMMADEEDRREADAEARRKEEEANLVDQSGVR